MMSSVFLFSSSSFFFYFFLFLFSTSPLLQVTAQPPPNPDQYPLNWTFVEEFEVPINAPAVVCVGTENYCYVVGGEYAVKDTGPDQYAWECSKNMSGFNLTSGEWHYNLSPLVKHRCFAQIGIVFDRPDHYKIFAIGGQESGGVQNPDGPISGTPYTEIYDLDYDEWNVVTPSLDFPHCSWNWNAGVSHHATVVVNTTIFVMGGGHGVSQGIDGISACTWVLETSNPNATWQIMNSAAEGGKLPQRAQGAGSAFLNNTVYFFGGTSCDGMSQGALGNCSVFADDDAKPVEHGPYTQTYRLDWTAGLQRAQGNFQAINWTEPGTAVWVLDSEMDIPRNGISGFLDISRDMIIASGGFYEDILDEVEVFNGTHWHPAYPLLDARMYAGAAGLSFPPGFDVKKWYKDAKKANGDQPIPVGLVLGGFSTIPGDSTMPLTTAEVLMGK